MQRAGAADTAGTGSCPSSHHRQPAPAAPRPHAGRDTPVLPSPAPGRGAAELWASAAPAPTLPASLLRLPRDWEGREGQARSPGVAKPGRRLSPLSLPLPELCLCCNTAIKCPSPGPAAPRGALSHGGAPSWALGVPAGVPHASPRETLCLGSRLLLPPGFSVALAPAPLLQPKNM